MKLFPCAAPRGVTLYPCRGNRAFPVGGNVASSRGGRRAEEERLNGMERRRAGGLGDLHGKRSATRMEAAGRAIGATDSEGPKYRTER